MGRLRSGTHDYLSRHDLAYRIRQLPDGTGAFMVKRHARTDREKRRSLVSPEMQPV